MKIALLRQRVTALGGAETTLSYLVPGLAAAGHEVTVYGAEPAVAAQAEDKTLVEWRFDQAGDFPIEQTQDLRSFFHHGDPAADSDQRFGELDTDQAGAHKRVNHDIALPGQGIDKKTKTFDGFLAPVFVEGGQAFVSSGGHDVSDSDRGWGNIECFLIAGLFYGRVRGLLYKIG